MAENKKSFILYCDSIPIIEKLSNERAGKLIKHIFRYCSDLNPVTDDEVVDMAFEHFKAILKRDLKKYESIVERNKGNGAKGGRPSKNPKNPVGYLETQTNPNKPKKADTDTDNDNVKEINTNLSVDWDKLKDNFNTLTGKKTKVVSEKVKGQIKARLKEGYTKQDLWNAIVNCFNDPYHKENPKYLTLEFISRSDKIEKYFGDIKKQKPKEDRL